MNRRAGFMMLELLTWCAVAGITFAAFLSFETFARRNSFEASARIQALHETERVIRRIEEDAAQAVRCKIARREGLILEIPSRGPHGETLPGLADTVIYAPKYEEGGSLTRLFNPADGSAAEKSSDSFARNLSEFSVRDLGYGKNSRPVIEVSLKFRVPVSGGAAIERRFTFAVALENCKAGGAE